MHLFPWLSLKMVCSPRLFLPRLAIGQNVATLAESAKEHFKAEIEGPFHRGGHWSWESNKVAAMHCYLLLVVQGYRKAPGLATASISGRQCHLILCVKS